ncbi:hypothetical protein KKC56_01865, partial [Patescibacteria group bacterium]|nr:hypothetical protein [Patescibacteria group bacterium]
IFFHKFNKKESNLPTPQIPAKEVENIETQQVPSVKYVTSDNIKNQDQNKETTIEDLKRMASAFAERFGSYSNHSDYSNISDLKIFMSNKMQVWADDFIKKQKINQEYSEIYSGITTQAILEEVKQFDVKSGNAEILVKTQRRESKGSINNASAIQQDIIIKFIKENGLWKINSAEWQN